MELKDFAIMGTCKHCGEWTKLFHYKGGLWCKPGMEFDKAKALSAGIEKQRRATDAQIRKAVS